MMVSTLIKECYSESFGKRAVSLSQLPPSGSDRQYFRLSTMNGTVIAAYNPIREENDAFVGFTGHFIAAGLPVPEIFSYLPDKNVYFIRDLGDDNLYKWLKGKPSISGFDIETLSLYRKILDNLVLFQTKGINGLDLDLCYPHKSFDRQSMMWDMNYFKYMLLKLLAVPFNEQKLEQDFISLADYLLEAGQEYFLYRDFQTANIMIVDDEPWFIDYQGGRRGAPQYDVASLLYDAKIPMLQSDRDDLLVYYLTNFCSVSGEDSGKFRGYYTGFSLIRVMQALGAFGFRGLYEHKPTFTESIVPGVKLITQIAESAKDHIGLPELYRTIISIADSGLFQELTEG
jgi:aminoglycoside/choline kinase family phosphotransferase